MKNILVKFSMYFLSSYLLRFGIIFSSAAFLIFDSFNLIHILLIVENVLGFIVSFAIFHIKMKELKNSKTKKIKIRSIREYKPICNISFLFLFFALVIFNGLQDYENCGLFFVYSIIFFSLIPLSYVVRGNMFLSFLYGYNFYVCTTEKSTSKIALDDILVISKKVPVDMYNNIVSIVKWKNDILFVKDSEEN